MRERRVCLGEGVDWHSLCIAKRRGKIPRERGRTQAGLLMRGGAAEAADLSRCRHNWDSV